MMSERCSKISKGSGGAGQPAGASVGVPIRRTGPQGSVTAEDSVAVEDPLEIRVAWPDSVAGQIERSIAVTMRTPGNDAELALGFLFSEGIVRSMDAVTKVRTGAEDAWQNRVVVELRSDPQLDSTRMERNFYVTSSCGVCGKASLDAVRTVSLFPPGTLAGRVSVGTMLALPKQMESLQKVFNGTGSIHAAAIFGTDGRVDHVFEDVGRHNALDKLLGDRFRAGRLPLNDCGILVSGRASFELVQKARMAGCPLLAAVGAPSSLAIELAWDADITLVGFLRDGRFNVYSCPARIADL